HDKSGPERILFSEKFACPVSGFTIPEIEPRLFSFNNPYGACPACGGLGVEQHIDEDLVIPDKEMTLRKGAIATWSNSSSPYYIQTLTALGKFYKFTLDTKWKDLPKKTQAALLHGSGDDEIKFSYEDGVRSYDTKKPFEGVITNLERRYRETESEWAREELAKYFSDIPCEACQGYRLKPEALCVKIGGKHIGEISELSVRKAGEWFETVPKALNAQQNEIAARVLKEIRERLSFLLDVGLNYLTLARASGTLSGGESQRIRLASQIGSGLTGVLYVLDEPSIGLHQRDNARLLETLKRLRDLGNTVIVVEHDEDAIRTADHVLDIGPGAGIHGGRIVAQGAIDDLIAAPSSQQSGDLYRRIHPDPRVVRRPAGGEGTRLRARPLFLQRQGRALRGLPRRRRDQDRDALPARRLRHLRRLQGQALQPRDARGAVQGQVDRRRARHDGRGGTRLLQGGAARAQRARAASPRRPRLHPCRPTGHH